MRVSRRGRGFAFIGVGLLALGCSAATAAERNQAGALDACALYGPGFTSVENSTRCVKIGGHIRVEVARSAYRYDSGRAGPDLPASDVGEPRHLRVGGDDRYGYDPFLQPVSSDKSAQ